MKIELAFEERIFEDKNVARYTTLELPFAPTIGDTFVWDEDITHDINKDTWEVISQYSFVVKERIVYSNGYVVLNLEII